MSLMFGVRIIINLRSVYPDQKIFALEPENSLLKVRGNYRDGYVENKKFGSFSFMYQ